MWAKYSINCHTELRNNAELRRNTHISLTLFKEISISFETRSIIKVTKSSTQSDHVSYIIE